MEAGKRILLVEDDKNLGYILSEYLSMKGFDVTWAKDGQKALALIKKNPIRIMHTGCDVAFDGWI
jgi:DNA-binding response OmpR family regulator